VLKKNYENIKKMSNKGDLLLQNGNKRIILSKPNGINVLSLFDGISCGMLALEMADIKVDKYYASEIEPNAIKVSQNNYPDIIRLGDVNNWRKWDVDWGNIDLLIGGSPCQGFSLAGNMLNFQDPRSKLFFVYVDILNYIKDRNPNIKFLLENVKMKAEWQDIISEKLGVQPVRINSSTVSAARRDRLYWANFSITQPEESNITFDDINKNDNSWLSQEYIDKVSKWKAQQKPLECATLIGSGVKLPCLTARGYNQSHSGMVLITDGERYRYLTNEEAELAMNLPQGYTLGVSDRERARCIGNGWTVGVIVHIFNCMKQCK
jgi:site-specific DNA-cytosine methylase